MESASADEGGKHDVRNEEEQLEHGPHGIGRMHLLQQGKGRNQHRIVRQRGKELRGHDGVEAAIHRAMPAGGVGRMGDNVLLERWRAL